jgi:hypothetical protein
MARRRNAEPTLIHAHKTSLLASSDAALKQSMAMAGIDDSGQIYIPVSGAQPSLQTVMSIKAKGMPYCQNLGFPYYLDPYEESLVEAYPAFNLNDTVVFPLHLEAASQNKSEIK